MYTLNNQILLIKMETSQSDFITYCINIIKEQKEIDIEKCLLDTINYYILEEFKKIEYFFNVKYLKCRQYSWTKPKGINSLSYYIKQGNLEILEYELKTDCLINSGIIHIHLILPEYLLQGEKSTSQYFYEYKKGKNIKIEEGYIKIKRYPYRLEARGKKERYTLRIDCIRFGSSFLKIFQISLLANLYINEMQTKNVDALFKIIIEKYSLYFNKDRNLDQDLSFIIEQNKNSSENKSLDCLFKDLILLRTKLLIDDIKNCLNEEFNKKIKLENESLKEIDNFIRKQDFIHALEIIEKDIKFFFLDSMFKNIYSKEDNPYSIILGTLYLKYGNILLDIDEKNNAKIVLEKALYLLPNNVDAYFDLSIIYALENNWTRYFDIIINCYKYGSLNSSSKLGKFFRYLAIYYGNNEKCELAVLLTQISLDYYQQTSEQQFKYFMDKGTLNFQYYLDTIKETDNIRNEFDILLINSGWKGIKKITNEHLSELQELFKKYSIKINHWILLKLQLYDWSYKYEEGDDLE
jgi:hypothetical protein